MNNNLKITLNEIKLNKNSFISDYKNFSLSISFNSKTITTDKFQINSERINIGKTFNFEMPKEINETDTIIVNSLGTSWMFFNTIPLFKIKRSFINDNDKSFKENNEKFLKRLNNPTISKSHRNNNKIKITNPNIFSIGNDMHLTNDSNRSSIIKENFINKTTDIMDINNKQFKKKNTFCKLNDANNKILSSSIEDI